MNQSQLLSKERLAEKAAGSMEGGSSRSFERRWVADTCQAPHTLHCSSSCTLCTLDSPYL